MKLPSDIDSIARRYRFLHDLTALCLQVVDAINGTTIGVAQPAVPPHDQDLAARPSSCQQQ